MMLEILLWFEIKTNILIILRLIGPPSILLIFFKQFYIIPAIRFYI